MNDFHSLDTSRHASDPSRHDAATPDSPANATDFNRYSYSVADALQAFQKERISVTERTIQRYCHAGKLDCIRINPDTRQLTTEKFFVFLIEPSSITTRIAQIREKQDISNPTVVATSPVTSRPVVTSSDPSRHDDHQNKSNVEEGDATESDTVASLRNQVAELETQNTKLEIEKKVSDRLFEEMAKDRRTLIEDVAGMGEQIGQLKAQLQLSAPADATANTDETATRYTNQDGGNRYNEHEVEGGDNNS